MKDCLENLRVMLFRELDEIAREGRLTHESLDIVKDLTSSIKNIYKIDMLEAGQEYVDNMDMEMSRGDGYSQRRGGGRYSMNSYNSYENGGGRGGMSRNSYRYYDPYMNDNREWSNRGYSRASSKEEMIEELTEMMHEIQDEKTKNAIAECIEKVKQ